MRINHNLASLNTYRQLSSNQANGAKALEKLSSGLRINKAGDDAAGLAISEKMRGQIRGLDQAARNSQDGISLIQTAEGALSETHSILQRMRELAVQSSNDTNVDLDRNEIQKEINQLTSEINRIGNTTQFNTRTLLNGSVNAQSAVTAKVTGGAVSGNISIIDAATNAKATGAVLSSTSSEISATGGLTVTGNVAYANHANNDTGPNIQLTKGTSTGSIDWSTKGASFEVIDNTTDGVTITGTSAYATHAVNDSGPNVTAADNELTVSLNGVQKSVSLAVADYSAGGNDSADTFATDIQTKIQALGGDFANVTVSFDSNDKLVFQSDDPTDTFTIDGGNALKHIVNTAGGEDVTDLTTTVRNTNNEITLTVSGSSKTLTLSAATYDMTAEAAGGGNDRHELLTNIQTELDSAFGAGIVTASLDGSHKLVFTNNDQGTSSTITSISGSATANLVGTASYVQGTENNELTLTLNGDTKSVSLAIANYSAGGNDSADDFVADIESKIQALGGDWATVSVGFDSNNKIVLTTGDSADTLTVDGGGAAALIGSSFTTGTEGLGNNSLSVSIGGVTKSITLADGTYDFTNAGSKTTLLNDLNAKLDDAFGASNAVASFDGSNKLVITNSLTGSTSTVGAITGSASSVLGLSSANLTQGQDANNTGTITVDGQAASITISAGTYTVGGLASDLQTQIRAADPSLAEATVNYTDGKFVVTSGSEGGDGSVVVGSDALWSALKLDSTNGAETTTGTDAVDQGIRLQVGANNAQSMTVDISDMRSLALKVSGSVASASVTAKDGAVASYFATENVTDGTSNKNEEYSLDVSTHEKATASLSVLDDAIASVSSERSKLGAFQNRLEHTINNLGTSSENLTASESRIRDVDMAKEMMEFTKNNILSQAAQAMLAQANQQPQGVLQLLR